MLHFTLQGMYYLGIVKEVWYLKVTDFNIKCSTGNFCENFELLFSEFFKTNAIN